MTGPLAVLLGFGLFGVFGLALTEKILPVPPSHVLLLFLGMTAAPGPAMLAALLAVTALGSLAGSLFWYGIGIRLGSDSADRAARRYGRYVFLRYETYQSLALAYTRNYARATFLAQFIPVARNYLGVAAGALRLPILPFIATTLSGAALWNAGFLIAGYQMRGADQDLAAVGFRIMVIVVAMETAFLLLLRYGGALRRWLSRHTGRA